MKSFVSVLLVSTVCCVAATAQQVVSQAPSTPKPAVPAPPPPKKPKPIPVGFTPSCSVKAPGVTHIYSRLDAKLALNDPAASVFLVHGSDLLNEANPAVPYFIENAPVYGGKNATADGLSTAELAAILKGEVTKWSDLGGTSTPIKVYLHGGELQRKSFAKLAETIGVDSSNLARVDVTYLPDYAALEAAAAADPNALVIGLKEANSESLELLTIDGHTFETTAVTGTYPLRVPLYLYQRPAKTPLSIDAIIRQIEPARLDTASPSTEKPVPRD